MASGTRAVIYGSLTIISFVLAVWFWLVTGRFSWVFSLEAVVATILTLLFGYQFFRLVCLSTLE